jgi:hypothetical protein
VRYQYGDYNPKNKFPKGGKIMKKLLAIILCALFVASFAVVGCKKEAPAPAEAPAAEAPADAAPAAEPAK